jgi:5'-3' exonuclease
MLIKKKLTIIDADSIAFLAAHNKKDAEKEKTFDDCKLHAEEIIKNILIATEADYYICCYTVRSRDNFRLKFYPEYKQNRKFKEPIPFLSEVKDFLLFESEYKSMATFDDEVSWEADDLCLSYYIHFKDEYECLISSPDKDIKNLNVPVYDYKKLEYNNPSEFKENYSMAYDLIAGQSGDGIKGIEGLGDKAAEKLLSGILEIDLFPVVLKSYINKYGLHAGIELFYSTYKALYIRADYPKERLLLPNKFKK